MPQFQEPVGTIEWWPLYGITADIPYYDNLSILNEHDTWYQGVKYTPAVLTSTNLLDICGSRNMLKSITIISQ
jgi:hypothetical protein